MKATGCDALLSDACIEQALRAVGMDYGRIFNCVQGEHGLGPEVQRHASKHFHQRGH